MLGLSGDAIISTGIHEFGYPISQEVHTLLLICAEVWGALFPTAQDMMW